MTRGPGVRIQRGSVVLVALCCVAVLGIALASYLALSNEAVKLSNRSYQADVSKQLAEMGLEQALLAFSKNDWDPTVWTIDATNRRASRTVSFPSSKFGNGVVASYRLRVDNFDAYNRQSTWTATPSVNYRVNDLVGYTDGMWYRCVQSHTSVATKAPGNLAFWAPAPIGWRWSANTAYVAGTATVNASVVCVGGTWYFCKADHTSGTTFSVGSNWEAMPQPPAFGWDGATNYASNSFVYSGGIWYRSTTDPNTGNPPPDPSFWSVANISWAYRAGANYEFDDVVYTRAGGVDKWYRGATSNPSAMPADWEDALSSSWSWSSTISYDLQDVVYSAGGFYRCILAHTNQAPPNSTYWSSAPLLSPVWDRSREYVLNDTVYCQGAWYRSLGNGNIGRYPVNDGEPSSGWWAIAPLSIRLRDTSRAYNPNDLVSDGTTWYRCIAAHVNQPTTNSTYWTPTTAAIFKWDPATAYAVGNQVSYGGAWYQCIQGNTNQTPNNSEFWTARQTPVVYVEGITTLPDSTSPIRVQIRALVAPASLFPNAAAATGALSLESGGTVDSYDSIVDPDALKRGFTAALVSTETTNPAVKVTSARVNGYVAAPSASSSPFAPLWQYGGSAVLTGRSTGTGIDLTRVSRAPSVPQFEPLPKPNLAGAFTLGTFARGTALQLSTQTHIGTPGAVTPSRYYYNGNLNIGGSSPLLELEIDGPVKLFINGDLNMGATSPAGSIVIGKHGSAEIHLAGGLKIDMASNGFRSVNKDPKALIVICDTTALTTHFYNEGANPFYGSIYAPYANTLQLSNTNTQIYGAISGRRVTFSFNANLHYDVGLQSHVFGGVDTPFTVSHWAELTDLAEKANFP